MKLYSTRNPNLIVDLHEAVLNNIPPEGGLYMPCVIPKLDKGFISRMMALSFEEIAHEVLSVLLNDALREDQIEQLVARTIQFPAPLVGFSENISCLELFHGPSLAFKDFGARFMAGLMSLFMENVSARTTILVATSGDTGGAVASGFFDVPNIDVVILYPSDRVSELQERQLTTWGKNIYALEVAGDFDDCQRLVKQAFVDRELTRYMNLSSANSINIARLIPQTLYYFEAFKQIEKGRKGKVVFSVPSGNFGNLTAGLWTKKMGLPVDRFVASTNVNDTVPNYLKTGIYKPKTTTATLSNAMDVGDPSNFERMEWLYGSTWNIMKDDISGRSYTDEETKAGMKVLYNDHEYVSDPHGAVAYLGLMDEMRNRKFDHGVFLETAHPIKFKDIVEKTLLIEIDAPASLNDLGTSRKNTYGIRASYNELRDFLMAKAQSPNTAES